MYKHHSHIILSLLLIAGLGFSSYAQKPRGKEKRIAKKVEDHIEYLASDELAGRGTGSEGEQLSAKYIAAEFEKIGLSPKGEDGYFQHLDITTLRIAQDQSSLMVSKQVYTLFKEFYPLSISADNGDYKGLAINVKSGIKDDHLKYNDYENVNVAGKAVMISMETPEMNNPHSKFAAYAGIAERVKIAIDMGAKAVIFYSSNADLFPSGDLKKTDNIVGIPVYFVKKDLSELKSPEVDLTVQIMALSAQASNVLGYVDNGAEYTVVVGAHHDHLGYGENGGSLAPESGQIHNGADDNASGVAAVIELARIVKSKSKWFGNNNYLFIAFTGEELGLVGSKYFVSNPTIPLEKINYMINMDMVGKLDSTEKVLLINGVGTSPAWQGALDKASHKKKKIADVRTTESGLGASDHTSFYLSDIPAVHFFTGQHSHYHKPSDDPEIVNYGGEAFVIVYICKWMEIMDDQGKVEFTKTKDESPGRMSFKVTLGIMPDYIFDGEGLRVDGVKADNPGEAAGLKKGDIIISMNGKPILDIHDYMEHLAACEPGQEVPITVKRGEEIIDLTVKF
ncbi:M28 family peptidase [bacterium]|nr:M28 family peptidase [bacterium]